MTTRRIPSGQRPARRPGQPGRVASRVTGRDPGARSERGTTARYSRGADAPRSATRPAAARRAAAGGGTTRTSAPQPRRFTGRATALFAVFVALALAYTYPVRVYLGQQADIAQLEAAQAAQREHIGDLSDEAALWKDPAYVSIQVRERFYMVRPGDKLVVVLNDPEGAARDAGAAPATAPKPAEPWYDMLWSSVRAANEEGPAS
ncbi:cell division protein FtsB [Micromonospora pisi]|uniref:Cell division protein FtsB n=1 Tax=Micromonospora pisi TaxID=589240 RepID=A0A495JN36_9ACTN|nr:septum formation initiator family protein [Micromonospora pisi]RKR90231.1 cell division protein FtsB [Micromonospora pisi]